MRHRTIIISNNIVFKVLEVNEHKYKLAKGGTIERHLKGNNLDNWLVDYTNYYVTVRNKDEGFDRIFVLTEQDAKNRLFIND